MLCDSCHENEAVIHIQEIRPDGNKTINLCPKCAMGKLIGMHPRHAANLEDILGDLAAMFEGKDAKVRLEQIFNTMREAAESQEDTVCPTCQRKRSQILQDKTIGCPDCLTVFNKEIHDLLEHINHTEMPLPDLPPESNDADNVMNDDDFQQFLKHAGDAFKAIQKIDQISSRVNSAFKELHDLDPAIADAYLKKLKKAIKNASPADAELFLTEISRLIRQLRIAIASEDYAQAANIRDRLAEYFPDTNN